MKNEPVTIAQPMASSYGDDNRRHLPSAARAAFELFKTNGDPATLDPVLCAILEDFIPHGPVRPVAQLPGDTRLIDDLGFDSMAITEMVFHTEETFDIKISNDEIIKVRTLDDLRNFIKAKVADRRAC